MAKFLGTKEAIAAPLTLKSYLGKDIQLDGKIIIHTQSVAVYGSTDSVLIQIKKSNGTAYNIAGELRKQIANLPIDTIVEAFANWQKAQWSKLNA